MAKDGSEVGMSLSLIRENQEHYGNHIWVCTTRSALH